MDSLPAGRQAVAVPSRTLSRRTSAAALSAADQSQRVRRPEKVGGVRLLAFRETKRRSDALLGIGTPVPDAAAATSPRRYGRVHPVGAIVPPAPKDRTPLAKPPSLYGPMTGHFPPTIDRVRLCPEGKTVAILIHPAVRKSRPSPPKMAALDVPRTPCRRPRRRTPSPTDRATTAPHQPDGLEVRERSEPFNGIAE